MTGGANRLKTGTSRLSEQHWDQMKRLTFFEELLVPCFLREWSSAVGPKMVDGMRGIHQVNERCINSVSTLQLHSVASHIQCRVSG